MMVSYVWLQLAFHSVQREAEAALGSVLVIRKEFCHETQPGGIHKPRTREIICLLLGSRTLSPRKVFQGHKISQRALWWEPLFCRSEPPLPSIPGAMSALRREYSHPGDMPAVQASALAQVGFLDSPISFLHSLHLLRAKPNSDIHNWGPGHRPQLLQGKKELGRHDFNVQIARESNE